MKINRSSLNNVLARILLPESTVIGTSIFPKALGFQSKSIEPADNDKPRPILEI